VGLSGERNARFAVDNDGSVHWGDGAHDTFHTSMMRVRGVGCSAAAVVVPGRGGVVKVCAAMLPKETGSAVSNRGGLSTCEAAGGVFSPFPVAIISVVDTSEQATDAAVRPFATLDARGWSPLHDIQKLAESMFHWRCAGLRC
jgi:hypothetical protein